MSKNETNGARRDTFAFYWSFKDAICDMSDTDKLSIYESITDFAFFGKEPDGLTGVGRLAWKLIQPQLEASIRRYDACVANGKKGAEFGKLGGAPKGNRNALKQPQRTTPKNNPKNNPLNHNDNVNDNHNGNEKGVIGGSDGKRRTATKRTAFVAPLHQEVKEYFSTIGGAEQDADSFFDHFTANGWRVGGKSPMKDWRAAARNWMRPKSWQSKERTRTSHENKPQYKAL